MTGSCGDSMDSGIKNVFEYYLLQLEGLVEKVPEALFSACLADDMLSLEVNAKVAANFALRGYCPLIERDVVSFFSETPGKTAVQKQLSQTLVFVRQLPDIDRLDETVILKDKAGFTEVELPAPAFIHQYIYPNFYFHISMVYAIARANGVVLGKRDFDGFHVYSKALRLK